MPTGGSIRQIKKSFVPPREGGQVQEQVIPTQWDTLDLMLLLLFAFST